MIDRSNYTRVTSVCGAFIDWSAIPEHVLAEKCEIGTMVHRLIELHLRGEEVGVIPEEAIGYMASFKAFWESSSHAWDLGTLELEKRLWCDKYRITGQPDVIIQGGSKTYIIDWKTSTSFHNSYVLQAAAYRYLAVEAGYTNVEPVLLARLHPAGKKPALRKAVENEDLENLGMFFKHLEVYRFNGLDRREKGENYED